MTVSRLTMNSMETLSESEQLFITKSCATLCASYDLNFQIEPFHLHYAADRPVRPSRSCPVWSDWSSQRNDNMTEKYFYKEQRFYYKVLQDRGRHANPYRKFNFAVISEKMSFQYRYTQISFPHCRLMIKAISFRSGENVWA